MLLLVLATSVVAIDQLKDLRSDTMLVLGKFSAEFVLPFIIAEAEHIYITIYILPSCVWKELKYYPLTIGIYITAR